MTLEELKNYPNGICLGYSSIGYLINKVYPLNLGLPKLEIYKEYVDSKLYPIITYYNANGKEGILCRPMVYKDNLLQPIGVLYSNFKPNEKPKQKQIAYVAKVVCLPIDTNIDSIYEVKREPIIVKG